MMLPVLACQAAEEAGATATGERDWPAERNLAPLWAEAAT
jgi:hypothetical protein